MMGLTPAAHESVVRGRFDALHARFRDRVEPDDFRLRAILRALGPVEGRLILDLGCGKGRFARRLVALGADVVGLDPSRAMLASASGCRRVCGSARRLPFADAAFDAVIAIEVFQHLRGLGPVLREVRRVLRPGGTLAVVDRNAWALDARRPWMPVVALKWLDERRGLWMYPPGSPVRERWFRPRQLAQALARQFSPARVEFLLSPSESESALFRRIARVRQFALWEARSPGVADGP